MTAENMLELAIIAFIACGIGAAIWRGGAANPVGTGGLDRKLTKLGGELGEVRVKVTEIEERVEDIDRREAKVADIKRLERQLAAHSQRTEAMARDIAQIRETAAARQAAGEHVSRQVDALYEVIVRKGMGA